MEETVESNDLTWDIDVRLDSDMMSDSWREKCVCARVIYDELSNDTKLKISNMIRVAKRKIGGMNWTNSLTLIMILMKFRLDPKNQLPE